MNTNTNTWRAVSAEQLTQFGKTAASTAETSGMSLTDAVVRSIGMTKLNQEQIRRVVEAANHEAYNRKFASMEASMRVVQLDGGPADPSAVIDRLHAHAQPVSAHAYSDYGLAPEPKTASFRPLSGPDGVTKTAALKDVYQLQERMKAAHEELASQVVASKGGVHETLVKLASLARTAVDEGAFYEDFERAWGAMSPKHATEILSVLPLPRAPEGVKTASRRISDGNPLLTEFAAFMKHAAEYEIAREAVLSVEAELVRIDGFLRSNA